MKPRIILKGVPVIFPSLSPDGPRGSATFPELTDRPASFGLAGAHCLIKVPYQYINTFISRESFNGKEGQRGVLCEEGKDREAEKISSCKHAKIIKQRCIRKKKNPQNKISNYVPASEL